MFLLKRKVVLIDLGAARTYCPVKKKRERDRQLTERHPDLGVEAAAVHVDEDDGDVLVAGLAAMEDFDLLGFGWDKTASTLRARIRRDRERRKPTIW